MAGNRDVNLTSMASPRSPSRAPLRAPAQPSSQPPRRRRHLTAEERAAIARERAQGVQVQELARRWGVSRQTIHATLRRLSEGTSGAPSTAGQGEARDGARTGARAKPTAPLARRSPTLSVRARTEEIEALDAAAARRGLSRPEALRRLVRNAGRLLAPDTAEAAHLAALSHSRGAAPRDARPCLGDLRSGDQRPALAGDLGPMRQRARGSSGVRHGQGPPVGSHVSGALQPGPFTAHS